MVRVQLTDRHMTEEFHLKQEAKRRIIMSHGPNKIVMAARTVVRWEQGVRIPEAAEPQRFTVERANEIFRLCRERATQGPYSDQYDKVMTPAERAFVMAVWDSNPNGNSSFDSTFHYIRNGELDRDVTNGTVTID